MYNHDEISALVQELRTLERIKGRSGAGSIEEAIASVQRRILEKTQMEARPDSLSIDTTYIDFTRPLFGLGTAVIGHDGLRGVVAGLCFSAIDSAWTYFVNSPSGIYTSYGESSLSIDNFPDCSLTNVQRQVLTGFVERYEKNYGPALQSEAPLVKGNKAVLLTQG